LDGGNWISEPCTGNFFTGFECSLNGCLVGLGFDSEVVVWELVLVENFDGGLSLAKADLVLRQLPLGLARMNLLQGFDAPFLESLSCVCCLSGQLLEAFCFLLGTFEQELLLGLEVRDDMQASVYLLVDKSLRREVVSEHFLASFSIDLVLGVKKIKGDA
jgi:hypothetical protein